MWASSTASPSSCLPGLQVSHLCTCIYVHVHKYKHTHTHTYTHTHTHTHYIYIYMIYICICICIYTCIMCVRARPPEGRNRGFQPRWPESPELARTMEHPERHHDFALLQNGDGPQRWTATWTGGMDRSWSEQQLTPTTGGMDRSWSHRSCSLSGGMDRSSSRTLR